MFNSISNYINQYGGNSIKQRGSGKCKFCGSIGTSSQSCPFNPIKNIIMLKR